MRSIFTIGKPQRVTRLSRLMRLCAFSLGSAAMALGAMSIASAMTPVRHESPVRVKEEKSDPGVPPFARWRAMYPTLSHPQLSMGVLRTQAAIGATVPFWTSTITSPLDGKSYTTSMVGSSPYATIKSSTNIIYVPIVVRWHFRNGVVLDPTKPACNDTLPITTRFFNSPLFQPISMTSNGVDVTSTVGGAQLINAFQRANFWTSASGSVYGITLVPSRATPIIIDVNAPSGSTVSMLTVQCGASYKAVPLGQIPINPYDYLVQRIIKTYATASQLPIILTYNVVQTYYGSCCVLGYHNAISVSTGTQTYAVGSYIDSGIFYAVDDVLVWSHELGEWADDPFVQAAVPGGGIDDLTPPWGNVGQVSGCQNNLEVGDPLSGTEFAIQGAGGYVYHFQDLAYGDWFYRTPSQGTSGRYSFMGMFIGVQGTC